MAKDLLEYSIAYSKNLIILHNQVFNCISRANPFCLGFWHPSNNGYWSRHGSSSFLELVGIIIQQPEESSLLEEDQGRGGG